MAPADNRSGRTYKPLIAVGLVAVVLGIYSPVFHAEFISFDDPGYITQNARMLSVAQRGVAWDDVTWAFTTFAQGNWHPFTWLSLMTDARLWGLANPGRFHLKNILLHAVTSALLFLVLARATKSTWRSAVVAALFAAHPLHVESVAWVSERKDVLAGLCFVLTLTAYVWYARRPGIGRYLVVAAMLALGLMAKPMLVTVPFVLLLVDIWPLQRIRWGKASSGATGDALTSRPGRDVAISRPGHAPAYILLEKMPLLALSAASCIITFIAQRAGGAVAGTEFLPVGLRAENALVSYLMYVEKMFYPADLSFFYPYPAEIPVLRWAFAAITLAAITVVVVLLVRRRPYLAVGWLWFVGMLMPVIGLVQVGEQALADRYTYLPLIGLFILIVWGAADLAAFRSGGATGNAATSRPGRAPAYTPANDTGGQAASGTRGIAAALGVAAVLVCGWLAHGQAACWTNTVELTGHALSINKKNHVAADALTYHFLAKGNLEDAAAAAEMAVDANPKYAPGWSNLATVRLRQNKLDKAEAAARKARELGYATPAALSTLGAILVSNGKAKEAEEPLRLALMLAPDMFSVRNDLAQALLAQGKTEEAVSLAEEACRQTARRVPMCLGTLAAAYAEAGRWDEAISTAKEAKDLASAQGHLGMEAGYRKRVILYQFHKTGREPVTAEK